MDEFDQAFFESVFYMYYSKLYSGFLKKTHSDTIAQELTQITFIKFWEYRSSYKTELSTELQLNRKAKLVFIDWLRKEAYQRKFTEELYKYASGNKVDNTFEISEALTKAMEKLSPTRKKVFTLAYIDGLSYKEIAQILDISVKTVSAHLQKALKQLRETLALYAVLFVIISL